MNREGRKWALASFAVFGVPFTFAAINGAAYVAFDHPFESPFGHSLWAALLVLTVVLGAICLWKLVHLSAGPRIMLCAVYAGVMAVALLYMSLWFQFELDDCMSAALDIP